MAGTGKELWRVRVDLFVEAGEAVPDTAALARSLMSLLTERDCDLEHGGDARIDHGLGIAKQPVA